MAVSSIRRLSRDLRQINSTFMILKTVSTAADQARRSARGQSKRSWQGAFHSPRKKRGSIRSIGDRRHRSPKRGLCAYEANSNGKTFDHPQSIDGGKRSTQEGKCGLMQIMSYAPQHIEDKHFRKSDRVQQAAGRRRIRKGSARTDLTRRGLGGFPRANVMLWDGLARTAT